MKCSILTFICCLIIIVGCQNNIKKNASDNDKDKENVSKDNTQYQPGSICTIEDGEGGFGVVKVLVIDDGVVHIKIYKNKFKSRPDKIDISELSLGSINDPDGFGVGRVPFGKEGFDDCKPIVVGYEEVKEGEFAGY